jgi:hypothetical protein
VTYIGTHVKSDMVSPGAFPSVDSGTQVPSICGSIISIINKTAGGEHGISWAGLELDHDTSHSQMARRLEM